MRKLGFVLLLLFTASLAAAPRPSLVVVISVDQFRYDYVDRFAPWFTDGGFRRFTARFPNARYRYGSTFTGPGHASIGTGRPPAQSGIVGNTWFERNAPVDAKQWEWYFDDTTPYRPPTIALTPFTAEGDWWWKLGGSPRYCVYDDRVQPTQGNTTGMSPDSLSEDGLGDRIKERYPGARVISVALKDRAAILMGGRRADAAYWFDYHVPAFISSTYYRFDPAVFSFNTAVAGYTPASAQWKPSPYIPAADLPRVTFDPPEAWPLKNTRYNGTFPHPIKDVRAMTYSPYAHELLLDFAQHVIATENLGMNRDAPDVLFVGVSATDYLGHYYGPDSMEVADSTVRLDRALEQFFAALERRFGDRVTVALTADHGVQANPEVVKLREPNADVGRIDLRNADPKAQRISDLAPLRVDMERALARRLGIRFDANEPLTHALVYFFEEPALYLNWQRIAELKLDGERVKRALRDVVANMKANGIDQVWTNTELLAPNAGASPLEQLMRNAFRADRSGDVLIALRPGWIWTWGTNSTSHGQPVENDLRVPLLFYGAGIQPGIYDDDASPLDLARTLGALLGVEAGGRESKVLPCIHF
jgi:predicted AlkP superfamily pyrophosphatase or phosphodiesterase